MAGLLIEIVFDEAKLKKIQRLLQDIPKALPRAMSRAINKTTAVIKTSMARQLIGPINAELARTIAAQRTAGRMIPKKRSKKPSAKPKTFNQFKMSTINRNIRFQKATYERWEADLWIKRFKGWEAIETSQTAFVAQMPKSGHISIFRRLGAARKPIADQLRRLMRKYFMGITEQVKQEAGERLNRNVKDQVRLALAEWKAVAGRAA